jgi:hypothetical protein
VCSKGCLNACPLWVCFTLLHSTLFIILPYPFTSHPCFLNSFQYTSLYLLPSHLILHDITGVLFLFSFSSFPEFHRAVPLLQTCSTSEFLYHHACFCAYLYLWIYLPYMRENTWLLYFWSWLTSLTQCPPIASIYLQITCHSLFLMAE